MKVKIDVTDIHQVIKASASENISIIAKENSIYIIGNDKDDLSSYHVMCKADYPWIDKPGRTLINVDVLKALPVTGELTITENTLECGNRKISYKQNNDEVEPITTFNHIGTINRNTFNDLIEVEYAMGAHEVRTILNGVFINGDEFVAMDGYRIAIRKSEEIDIQKTLLPTKLIKTYKKIKNKSDEVIILETENEIALKVDNMVILTAKVPGEYVRYENILPTEFTTQAILDSKELLQLLKSYKNVKYVTLNFIEEELKITAKNETLTIEDALKCKLSGNDLEIVFDTKYLMDAIKNYTELKFNLISSVQPVLITEGYKTDLIMPVRINKN